jgi:hypothetical protein
MSTTGLRVQHGCHDCKHVKIISEYDDGNFYYCTKNVEPCPEGWNEMKEKGETELVALHAEERFINWKMAQERRPWQICLEWVERKETPSHD